MSYKTLAELEAETVDEVEVLPDVVEPVNNSEREQKTVFQKYEKSENVELDKLVSVLSKPIEEKDHEQRQKPPETLSDLGVTDVDFEEEEFSEPQPEPEPIDYKKFQSQAGVFVMIMVFVLPFLAYMADLKFIKSGLKRSDYELKQEDKDTLQEKAVPVLADLMINPPSPIADLLLAVVMIFVTMLSGAFIHKTMKIDNETTA